MATVLTQTHPLLTIPFSAATDFTELANYCAQFTNLLIETDDPTLRLALCGRLTSCLKLLQSTLDEPVPQHLVESLTVDSPPDKFPCFSPGFALLSEYCLVLAQSLAEKSLLPEAEKTMTGLLADLVWYFTDELQVPRWIRTTDGVKVIDEVM